MQAFERYLGAIRRELPAGANGVGADDIIAELRDDLLTRIETREEALGRPLDKAETEALLREFGQPVVVAARYRDHQYLIGPETFPFYLVGLRVGLLIVAIVVAVLVGTELAFGPRNIWQAGAQIGSTTLSMLVTGFGIVTLIFAAVERRGGVKAKADWKLDDLPSLDDLSRDARRDAPIEIVFGTLFLLWWFGVIPLPTAGWGEFNMRMAPVFTELFWPIAALLAGRLLMSLLTLVSRLAPLRHMLAVATTIMGLVILVGLYQAGHWVEIGPGTIDAERAAKLEESVNLALRIALVAGLIGWTLGGIGGLWKWWRRRAA